MHVIASMTKITFIALHGGKKAAGQNIGGCQESSHINSLKSVQT